MSHQLLSANVPPLSPDPVSDCTHTYSSFEHFVPGLQFLSNDPASEAGQLASNHQQQQQQQQQHQELRKDSSSPGDTINSNSRRPDDSDFVDLLYVVDSSGK